MNRQQEILKVIIVGGGLCATARFRFLPGVAVQNDLTPLTYCQHFPQFF